MIGDVLAEVAATCVQAGIEFLIDKALTVEPVKSVPDERLKIRALRKYKRKLRKLNDKK